MFPAKRMSKLGLSVHSTEPPISWYSALRIPEMPRAANLRRKGRFEQRGVHHRPIHVPAIDLIALQREHPDPHWKQQRARIAQGRVDPQMDWYSPSDR